MHEEGPRQAEIRHPIARSVGGRPLDHHEVGTGVRSNLPPSRKRRVSVLGLEGARERE